MKNNKNLKSLSHFALIVVIVVFLLNIKNIFIKLNYIYLFVDERQLIDDIYNVFFLNDEFQRFSNIDNQFVSKVLIFFSEILIGGNLDYGRLWNNLFVFICAPFFVVSQFAPIVVERFLLIVILYFSIFYFARHFIPKKYQNIFVLFTLSAPGIFYVLNPPKPDVLALLTMFVAFKYLLKDRNYNRGFIFIGISIGIKFSMILLGFLVGCYLIYPLKKIDNLEKIIKSIIYTLTGIVIAQPALIIPYPPLFERIISQTKAAVLYNETNIGISNNSLSNIDNWLFSLENIFSLNRYILIFFFLLLIFELINNLIKKLNLNESIFLMLFCFSLIFYCTLISRVWIYYLLIPFIYLNCYLFLILGNKKSIITKLILSFYILISLNGFITNLESEINKGFEENTEWTLNLYRSLDFIEDGYNQIDNPYNLVYWDPTYYFPKQKLTYNADFKVIENWDSGKKLEPLDNKVDFIVTREKILIDSKYSLKTVGDLYIYFISDQ
jgi:hypothetical protein